MFILSKSAVCWFHYPVYICSTTFQQLILNFNEITITSPLTRNYSLNHSVKYLYYCCIFIIHIFSEWNRFLEFLTSQFYGRYLQTSCIILIKGPCTYFPVWKKLKPKYLYRQLVADCSVGYKPCPSMFVDHTDSCISRLFWLHFLIVGGSGAMSSIFIYSYLII